MQTGRKVNRVEDKTELWLREHWKNLLYISSLILIFWYYVSCFSKAEYGLYILPSVNNFFNLLLIIDFIVLPIVWIIKDLRSMDISKFLKLLSISLLSVFITFLSLIVIILLNIFNPMTLSIGAPLTYNPENGLYYREECGLHHCYEEAYYSESIFLRRR